MCLLPIVPGFRHEGTPKGRNLKLIRYRPFQTRGHGLTYRPAGEIKEVGGARSYIATPEGSYAKDKVLLFLPDVFGIELDNGKVCYLSPLDSVQFIQPMANL